MKPQRSLLAMCLFGIGIANAQTTTNTSSTPGTATSPTTTSPSTTEGTNSTTSGTMSNGTSTTNGETLNNSSTGTNSGTSSTNSMTSPATSVNTTATTTTTTDTYSTTDRPVRVKNTKLDYKNFVFGIYAGLNTTKFKGETINTGGKLSGRLGYQAGFFVRGGGRLFGQLGAEYFASSSNYFVAGSGQSAKSIQDQIDIQYVQIPLYIGYKLLESDRGISAIRLQAGLEYANRINSKSGQFKLTNEEIKSGTFNALGQVGFDIGPFLIDLTYHHGLSDSIKNPTNSGTVSTGFTGSQRRIVSASVGFKF